MLKTILIVNLIASAQVRNEEQDDKKIQIENQDNKKLVEPIQKYKKANQKAKKQGNPKNGLKQKKERLQELKTLAAN